MFVCNWIMEIHVINIMTLIPLKLCMNTVQFCITQSWYIFFFKKKKKKKNTHISDV